MHNPTMKLHDRPLLRKISNRRNPISGAIVCASIADIYLGGLKPIDLLSTSLPPLGILAWALLLSGVIVRLWAAGNLRKNEKVVTNGIYALVRHPLYLGTFLIYLSYFISFGNLLHGLVLYSLMLILSFMPKILLEEELLKYKFPDTQKEYAKIPRLIPNPLMLGRALRTDRFSLRHVHINHGFTSLWGLLLIPGVLKILSITTR